MADDATVAAEDTCFSLLTPTGRRKHIFKIATTSLPRRYANEIEAGMTDEELSDALQSVLGIFGGSGGPDRYSITFMGSGLAHLGWLAMSPTM